MDAGWLPGDNAFGNMNAQSKRKCLVEAISAGIDRRDFYIVPAAEEIPGCCGNRSAQLEYVREFARDHGWHVTVHDGNGWLLFTASGRRAPKGPKESDLGRLLKMIEMSLSGSQPVAEAVPFRGTSAMRREIRREYGN
jgi:hypothetical protein